MITKPDLLTDREVADINRQRYDAYVWKLVHAKKYVQFNFPVTSVSGLFHPPLLLMHMRCACVVPWQYVELHESKCCDG